MSKVEIEVESGPCENCNCKMAEKPEESKDALLKQLKDLLGKNDTAGQADRQLAIDALIEKIGELED